MTISKDWIETITASVGPPTDFQWLCFEHLQGGGSFLLRSGTGSGKTLAALVPCLAALRKRLKEEQNRIEGQEGPPVVGVRLLYVSPLRALLADMKGKFDYWIAKFWDTSSDGPAPEVTLLSGDTPSPTRKRFRETPTPILLTTPESLSRLLAHPDRTGWFGALETVIVDEWHALAGTKRGADLSLLLERLQTLTSQPLARIGLSATIANPEQLARCLVGTGNLTTSSPAMEEWRVEESASELDGGDEPGVGGGAIARSIRILSARQTKSIDIEIRSIPREVKKISFAAEALLQAHDRRPTTGCILCFVATRSGAENLAYKLTQNRADLAVRLHHGSLSRRTREETEFAMREGRVNILIASSSLELGIDLGGIREVFLLDPPGEVIRLLQRIGRSGRGPGQIPRGVILAEAGSSLFEAAVTSGLGEDGWMETIEPPHQPLDLLCQHLLGEALARPYDPDEFFLTVRKSSYFRHLERADFDRALAFLSGWPNTEGESRLPRRLAVTASSPELPPKIFVPSMRTARIIRQALGTIVTNPMIPVFQEERPEETDRESRSFKGPHSGAGESAEGKKTGPLDALIGLIDEWYADSIQPGDRFLLNGRSWERTGGNHREIVASESFGRPVALRWDGMRSPFSQALASKLFALMALAKTHLRESPEELIRWLRSEFPLGEIDAEALAAWIEDQDRVSQIPEPGLVVVESVACGGTETHWDLHLPMARQSCHHLGQIAAFRANRLGLGTLDFEAADLGLRFWDPRGQLHGHGADPLERLKLLLEPAHWEDDWSQAVQTCDQYRRNFQTSAEICLMIVPPGFNPRTTTKVGGRAWAARRLFDRLSALEDQALPLIQAMRDLMRPTDRQVLGDWFAQSKQVLWRLRSLTRPSPLAQCWRVARVRSAADQEMEERILAAQRALGDV